MVQHISCIYETKKQGGIIFDILNLNIGGFRSFDVDYFFISIGVSSLFSY